MDGFYINCRTLMLPIYLFVHVRYLQSIFNLLALCRFFTPNLSKAVPPTRFTQLRLRASKICDYCPFSNGCFCIFARQQLICTAFFTATATLVLCVALLRDTGDLALYWVLYYSADGAIDAHIDDCRSDG